MSTKTRFVWFDNRSRKTADTVKFYQGLLDWKTVDGPPDMTMFGDDDGPWSAISEASPDVDGWLPYAEVEALDPAIDKAKALGAEVVHETTKGPAGRYCIVRDPGGALLALWKRD